jgi:hypothetical protein
MTDNELDTVLGAIEMIVNTAGEWSVDYNYSQHTNEYTHKLAKQNKYDVLKSWFYLRD